MTGEFVLQEVERTGHAFAEAREALRMACVRAVARGASLEAVAETSGVHPGMVQSWVDDQGRSRPKAWVDRPVRA